MDSQLQEGDVLERTHPSTLTVSLHPVVLMCVADHYTRITVARQQLQKGGASGKVAQPIVQAAAGGPNCPPRVIGALLGTRKGRHLEIHAATELVLTLGESGQVAVDQTFMSEKLTEVAKVFPNYEFIGWYAVGKALTAADVALHRQFLEINESPLVLLLDAQAAFQASTKDLPVQLFEPEVRMVNERAITVYAPLPYTVETNEAERVSVDHVAHMSAADATNESSQLQSHLASMHSAVNMLRVRIQLLLKYLVAVQAGDLEFDHDLLLQASSLCSLLPALESPSFRVDFFTEHNDGLLVAYLATLTKNVELANQLVERCNVAFDRGGPSSSAMFGGGRRRGGVF